MRPLSRRKRAPSADALTVSVIVPTYNSLAMLRECLDSVHRQTLPSDQIEVIVIDDGSTDGTWDYLSQLQHSRPNLRIMHQGNAGRPSVGRNRGIAAARGRYLFFLDADDWLGDDALRRLTEAADEHGSDVVLGRGRGVGRGVHTKVFAKTVYDADIVETSAWRILGPWKLFRAELVHRLGARFPEDMVQGEDQVFVGTCYFAARKVTVLADYDYYYVRGREDGQNISRQPQSLHNKLLTTTRMSALIVANSRAGRRRQRLFERVLLSTLPPALNVPFQAAEPTEREHFLEQMQQLVLPHLSDDILDKASDERRLRLELAKTGTAEELARLNVILKGTQHPIRQVDGSFVYELPAALTKRIRPQILQVRGDLPIQQVVAAADFAELREGLAVVTAMPRLDLPRAVSRLRLQERTTKAELIVEPVYTFGSQRSFELSPVELREIAGVGDSCWDFFVDVLSEGVCFDQQRLSWQRSSARPLRHQENVVPGKGGQPVYSSLYATEYHNVSMRLRDSPSEHSAQLVELSDGTAVLEVPAKSARDAFDVRVMDLSGRVLHRWTDGAQGDRRLRVDVGELGHRERSGIGRVVLDIATRRFRSQLPLGWDGP